MWHSCSSLALELTKTRGNQHPVLVRSFVNMACALHSSEGEHAGCKVSVATAVDGANWWEETALVLTADATDTYLCDEFSK